MGDGTGNTTSTDLKARRDALFVDINDARGFDQDCGVHGTKPSVGSLARSAALDRAAQAHAEDMSLNDFVSHVGSDGSSFWVRANRAGDSNAVGENIAAGHSTATAVVNAWINSDGHCKNLMSGTSTRVGVGYAKGVAGGSHGHYWVMVNGSN